MGACPESQAGGKPLSGPHMPLWEPLPSALPSGEDGPVSPSHVKCTGQASAGGPSCLSNFSRSRLLGRRRSGGGGGHSAGSARCPPGPGGPGPGGLHEPVLCSLQGTGRPASPVLDCPKQLCPQRCLFMGWIARGFLYILGVRGPPPSGPPPRSPRTPGAVFRQPPPRCFRVQGHRRPHLLHPFSSL